MFISKVEYSDEAAKIMWLSSFIKVLTHLLVLHYLSGFTIDFENSRNSTLINIRHDYEVLRSYPNRYRLKIQLFRVPVVLKNTWQLVDQ